MTSFRPHRCEFARRAAALRLDEELSQFENAMLVAHLSTCAECHAFARELEALTEAVRTSPLVRAERSFVPPRRQTAPARLRALSAATAVAAVVVMAFGLGSSQRVPDGVPLRDVFQPTAAQINSIESDDVLVRDLKFTPPRPPKIGAL